MIRFAFLLLALSQATWAGGYLISPATKNAATDTTGLSYTNFDQFEVVDDTTDYYRLTSGSSVDLVISGISIKQGFTWKSVKINANASDYVEVTIRDASGGTLLEATQISTDLAAIDLSQTEAAKRGKALTITVKFNSTTSRLYSIKLEYEGAGVFAFPTPYVISEGELSISYDIPNDAVVTLAIYDNRGRLVKQIYKNQTLKARASPKDADKWDGRNSRGNKVTSGLYLIYVSVRFTSQSNTSVADYTSTFRFVALR